MNEALSTGPSLQETISKVVETMNSIGDSLFSLLSTSFEQVADFGRYVMSSLFGGNSSAFTDAVIQSLVRMKLHLQDLVKSLEFNNNPFDRVQLIGMLENKKSRFVDHMENNQGFRRSYGRYYDAQIRPLLDRALDHLS